MSTFIIRDPDAAALSQVLAVNSSLTSLNLNENSIDDSGATSLSQALATNSSIISLNLSGNSIGASGASSLSQGLATNPSLTISYLGSEEDEDKELILSSPLPHFPLSKYVRKKICLFST